MAGGSSFKNRLPWLPIIPSPALYPWPQRPAARYDFEIARICALPFGANAADAVFDHHYWDDDGPPYDNALGDPNAYSTSTVERHNFIPAHMMGMGKADAATVAANIRVSFSNMSFSIYLLATAFGPLFISPLSEIYGKQDILRASNPWFLIWNLMCGFSNTTFMKQVDAIPWIA